MAEPFVSEIRIMGFTFPPRGWAHCDGAELAINQNQALFALLGTMYGGNGQTTFKLPDLRGRAPLHRGRSPNGANYAQGQSGGEADHTLTIAEIPPHTHPVRASGNAASSEDPAGRLAANNPSRPYASLSSPAAMRGTAVAAAGGSPHENMQPYLALNFCIALQGVFPSRN